MLFQRFYRGSLRRVNDGTEALLILPLFILWLDKVSTAGQSLYRYRDVEEKYRQGAMAVLDSCPKHNMVAYLEKTEGNAEFHEIIDFLKRSSIHHALTVSPVVSTTLLTVFASAKVSDQAKNNTIMKASDHKLKKQAKHVIQNIIEHGSVSNTRDDVLKGESSVQRDPQFDIILEDSVDHMETENAQDEGRTREMVDEDKEIDEIRLSTEDVLSTDKEGVSTDKEKVSTEEHKEGTEEHNEGSEEQREGTEEKVESTDGQRKGKKKIEEEDESDGIPQAEKKFKQLESDEELARKMQEEWEEEEEKKKKGKEKEKKQKERKKEGKEKGRKKGRKRRRRRTERERKEKKEKQKETKIAEEKRKKGQKSIDADGRSWQEDRDRFQDEIPEGFDRVLWGDLMVMFNPDDENDFWNAQQDWNIVSWKLHGSSGVHTLVTETGLVIHMLVEKRYPLRKEVLMQMLKLKLESEEDSTMALELIRFIKKILAELEPEAKD
ncbi:hypothetical protein Tco_1467067 [Tanacetum coccineum]